MPEDQGSEAKQEATTETGSPHRHRRRRKSHHKGWEFKRGNAKTMRTIIMTGLAVLAVVIVWLVLVSRPV